MFTFLRKKQKMLNNFNEKVASHQQFTQSLRKITDEVTSSMLTRTAKEQYKEAMETLKQNSIPESDNYFVTAKHLM